MIIVATTSLTAGGRLNADRWNADRSCQNTEIFENRCVQRGKEVTEPILYKGLIIILCSRGNKILESFESL